MGCVQQGLDVWMSFLWGGIGFALFWKHIFFSPNLTISPGQRVRYPKEPRGN